MVFFNHLLMLLLIDTFSHTLCNIGKCRHYYDSNDWFCCDHFEMRENMCVECRLGYKSFSKQICIPCLNNTYGKRCAGICSCLATERCDNIKGCVNDSRKVIVTTETYIEAEETTTNNASLSSKSTTIFIEEKFTGNCSSEFNIVISGSIGLFIGVGVSVIFMVCIKIIQKRKDSAVGETHPSSEIQMETLNNYEEINDIILISHDTYINQNEENSDTSRSSIDIEYRSQNENNADYLNPYQPIVPITDSHLYKTMETSADNNTVDQVIAAVDPSLISVDEQNDGTDKNESSSCISQRINYAELELSTTDKYENVPIISILPTKDQPSTHKTQYAEIVQTV